MKIAQATYHWSDAATAGNFKLALRGKAIDWLNYNKDTEQIDISLWSRIEPQSNHTPTFKSKQWTMFGTFQNEV